MNDEEEVLVIQENEDEPQIIIPEQAMRVRKKRDPVDPVKKQIAEKIGKKRLKGMRFAEISREYNLDREQVQTFYKKFLELSKAEWLAHRDLTITEINEHYKKKMMDAERNYSQAESAGSQPGMAMWTKLMLETLNNYVGFLKEIGFVDESTASLISGRIQKDEGDPLVMMVSKYREHLKERITAPKEIQVESSGNSGTNP